jgi:hypothetical protein
MKYLLTGQKIFNFTIGSVYGGLYECVCMCGSKRYLSGTNLVRGRYKSCGCLSNPYHPEYLENFKKKFWSKVKESQDGCRVWTGTLRNGYGRIGYQRKQISCTRLIWEWNNGPIPDQMLVCHKCDNPSCVNIDHLFLGNAKENMDDCVRKKRRRDRKGQDNANSRLTEEEVIEIHTLLSLGETQREIGEKYNVSKTTIARIQRKENWGHINI